MLLPWAGLLSTTSDCPSDASKLASNTSRDGAATTSQGNLFQHLTTHWARNFSLTSNLNFPILKSQYCLYYSEKFWANKKLYGDCIISVAVYIGSRGPTRAGSAGYAGIHHRGTWVQDGSLQVFSLETQRTSRILSLPFKLTGVSFQITSNSMKLWFFSLWNMNVQWESIFQDS